MSDASNSVIVKPCTAAEIAFYETARDSHPAFAAYMPTFIGQLELASSEQAALLTSSSASTPVQSTASVLTAAASTEPNPDKKAKPISTNLSIVLSNATAPFLHPNILDVKLGSQLWDDTADDSKRERLSKVATETTSGSLGFRIAGMRMWQPPKDENEEGQNKDYGKLYGRAFSAQNVRDGFEEYLGVKAAPQTARRVAKKFRAEVEGLRRMLEAEESRMVAASILFVYEGDAWVLEKVLDEEDEREYPGPAIEVSSEPDGEDSNGGDGEDNDDDGLSDDDTKPVSHNIKLIDFAHARFTPGEGPDENALQGVRSVIKILDEIAAEADGASIV
jgi:1D-myo-inositol-tetrakisphosphate 5-kinase/inositol-polyphosphate multikinase